MLRPALLSALAALVLSAGSASAQDAGGVRLSPEVFQAENAQAFVRSKVLFRLQELQMSKALAAGPQGVTTASNVAVQSDRAARAQAAIARIRGDAGFLGGFAKGQALAPSRQPVPEPELIEFPPPVVLEIPPPIVINAPNGAVTVGDGNVVQQQVVSSIVNGNGGVATASAVNAPQGDAPQSKKKQ